MKHVIYCSRSLQERVLILVVGCLRSKSELFICCVIVLDLQDTWYPLIPR